MSVRVYRIQKIQRRVEKGGESGSAGRGRRVAEKT